MAFCTVHKCDDNGRIELYQPNFETLQDAQDHLASVVEKYPKAFAHEQPDTPTKHWVADMDAQTLVSDDTADLVERKKKSKQLVVEFAEALAAELTSGITEAEQKAWGAKQDAALAVQAASATPEQLELLQIEASITGETVPDLSVTILARASMFRKAAATITGVRRVTQTAIDNAASAAQIDQILETAKADAIQKFQGIISTG